VLLLIRGVEREGISGFNEVLDRFYYVDTFMLYYIWSCIILLLSRLSTVVTATRSSPLYLLVDLQLWVVWWAVVWVALAHPTSWLRKT